jgi:hypothetical protein
MPAKQSRGDQGTAADLSRPIGAEIERQIQKGHFKDAVKQAKLLHKRENTPETRRLLERAYFLRADQLFALGMHTSAAQVARHLLDFGVTASDGLTELTRLLVGLELEGEAFALHERLGRPEERGRLEGMAADWAVVSPRRAARAGPRIEREARLVRESLAALQAHDETSAVAMLRDLPRRSPLSEWRFFARGLAAFYRRDETTVRANWERLDAERMAAQIALRLTQIVSAAGPTPARDKSAVETLETEAFGEPVLERLSQVCEQAARQEWERVLHWLGPLRRSLERIDPHLAERLTSVLSGSVIREAMRMDVEAAHRLVNGFTQVAKPTALDPEWSRLWALVWDGPHAEKSGAKAYWSCYAQDLERLGVFTAPERSLAQALVWNHVAELCRSGDQPMHGPGPALGGPWHGQNPCVPEARPTEAEKCERIACLEQSLALAHGHLPTYRSLVGTFREWGDRAEMAAAAQRLLAVFPDDLETLSLLARHQYSAGAPGLALPLALRARGVRPLDESLRDLEWKIRVDLARQHALAGSWDLGRAEFRAADALYPERRGNVAYLARKAVFESAAGEVVQSQKHLIDAREALRFPAPLWLVLLIESVRYDMGADVQMAYARLWEEELEKPWQSESAGVMARLLEELLGSGLRWPAWDAHLGQLVEYLVRFPRSGFRRADVEAACQLLCLVPAQGRLLAELVELGLASFPESLALHYRAGSIELAKGPLGMRERVAREHLERALDLAEHAAGPGENALCPQIRSMLSWLSEICRTPRQNGRSGRDVPTRRLPGSPGDPGQEQARRNDSSPAPC